MNISNFREKSPKVRRKYDVFIGFRHTKISLFGSSVNRDHGTLESSVYPINEATVQFCFQRISAKAVQGGADFVKFWLPGTKVTKIFLPTFTVPAKICACSTGPVLHTCKSLAYQVVWGYANFNILFRAGWGMHICRADIHASQQSFKALGLIFVKEGGKRKRDFRHNLAQPQFSGNCTVGFQSNCH